ncbi:AAA family ATPase [Mucilaginibacter rubeus]|uniref:AAA family ATPase n=1 Tax=Mucilaginibacter rubeus TaxID=2027860 RepID=A0AAE6JBA8_9SPHI|nr:MULTISPECIES: AAA family ATPase [Mucilaginibacter]QEM02353.1 AAA family ATPase [Mucilaginibacter rubeus]QEM14978.1 AAA family ATPase [Mucilaginibacter gossypii]QTE42305.1 AAA family ATPase [Mucilaginibacter rubeus]QTE48906.1 AAA family ATPase [Mucilaginibacter rubeus]QTE54004.1 AAA family ATPase [Mucilaginibacter rubeus]
MHINIFGASGSGVTTLGNALSEKLNYPYFDSDHYFWFPSAPPFTNRRPPEERNAMINREMAGNENWILGGSVINWNNNWRFGLSVFLYIPPAIRIRRLQQRELERYGDIIYTDRERNNLYNEFIDWARGYDELITNSRSLHSHKNWMNKLTTPLLIIEGDTTVEERVEAVLGKIGELSFK